MKFILIVTLYFYSTAGRSVSTDSIEFNTKDACIAAGEAFVKRNSAADVAVYLCAAKGAEK